jgi:hypothetical protein
MAKTKYEEYDATPANNTDIDTTINIDEGMVPSAVNNAIRAQLSHTAKHFAADTIASATTCDLGSKAAHALEITGTTTITGFGTIKAGTVKFLNFAGALVLTHNASSLILPGGANITTAAGDTAVVRSLGSGNWRCLAFQRAAGAFLPVSAAPTPTLEGALWWDSDDDLIKAGDGASTVTFTRVVILTAVATTSGTSHSFNIPSWAKEVVINFSGLSTNGTSALRIRLNGNSSGYLGGIGIVSGSPSYTAITDGFGLNTASATAVRHGQVRLSLIDASNGTWACSGTSADSGSSNMGVVAGSTIISGDLSSVAITTVNGTDTFDAGKINVTYF